MISKKISDLKDINLKISTALQFEPSRRVSVCFISFFVLIVFVSLLKSILGKPKILCLDSSCAGQSFMRWSAVSSFFWRCEQSLQYIVEAVLSLLECLLSHYVL